MNGYMNGASTEPELNTISAASNNNTITSGTNHHFFSCHKKPRNSRNNRHMNAHSLNQPDTLATAFDTSHGAQAAQ
jgi:hypothetical protein